MSNHSDVSNDVIERIRAIPIWSNKVTPTPLHGGLSNESFTVVDGDMRFVVRFGQDYPYHHVSRDRELMSARAAFEADIAPEVVFSDPGVMVSRFIDAKTFTATDVIENTPRVARLIRKFHDDMPARVSGPAFLFWVFHVNRDYARTLRQGQSRMSGELASYLELNDALEAMQLPLPIIFGHNDLLPANILDDGSRLWLIDFEYAGFSTAMFDLAGTASNAEFDESHSETFLGEYFGKPPTREFRKSHSAMQCASLLREAMWSMVSEIHLDTPGVDFKAYTAENLERLESALDRHQSAFGALV